MKNSILVLATACLLVGCAQSGPGLTNANANLPTDGIAVSTQPRGSANTQVMMPGQGAMGMPQSTNSLPVGAAQPPL